MGVWATHKFARSIVYSEMGYGIFPCPRLVLLWFKSNSCTSRCAGRAMMSIGEETITVEDQARCGERKAEKMKASDLFKAGFSNVTDIGNSLVLPASPSLQPFNFLPRQIGHIEPGRSHSNMTKHRTYPPSNKA